MLLVLALSDFQFVQWVLPTCWKKAARKARFGPRRPGSAKMTKGCGMFWARRLHFRASKIGQCIRLSLLSSNSLNYF